MVLCWRSGDTILFCAQSSWIYCHFSFFCSVWTVLFGWLWFSGYSTCDWAIKGFGSYTGVKMRHSGSHTVCSSCRRPSWWWLNKILSLSRLLWGLLRWLWDWLFTGSFSFLHLFLFSPISPPWIIHRFFLTLSISFSYSVFYICWWVVKFFFFPVLIFCSSVQCFLLLLLTSCSLTRSFIPFLCSSFRFLWSSLMSDSQPLPRTC